MKAKKWIGLATVLALVIGAFALAGCSSNDSSANAKTSDSGSEISGSVSAEGSDTIVNMSNAWAEAFQKKNPNVMVSVKGGGSGVGITSLINGNVDFANASREMKPEEEKKITDSGRKVTETEVAYDGISVIVNPDNPVKELTSEQLGKIYRGEITNWKDVGGPDKKIVILSRDSSSGTFEFFSEEIVGKDEKMAKSAQLLASTQAIVDEVSKNDAAIGYCGLGYVTDKVHEVKLDGVLPSVATVLDKSYPLSRGLYMYSAKTLDSAQKAFLDFILSSDGQKIVKEQGFVPLNSK